MSVLFLTNANDSHLPFVEKHLSQQAIRIDIKDILQGSELSFETSKETPCKVTYRGRELRNITGVWLRKATVLHGRYHPPVPEEWMDYSKRALNSFAKLLFGVFGDAIWISDAYAIQCAENKMLQSIVARQVGFTVPDTLFTSSSERAREFTHSQEAVAKSLGAYLPKRGGKRLSFYTSDLSKKSVEYEGLHLAPAIFQQKIQPKIEYRVTVVGEKVFAASVTLREWKAVSRIRDWRAGHINDTVVFEATVLSEELERQCILLTKRLGLNYGAIDLIEDMNGAMWFLEINPNGQWAFIEKATQLPISKAIAHLLEQPLPDKY